MKIVKKISEKAKDRFGKKIPTIAFLGDSVTQGCFEIYKINETSIETVFDKNCAYHNYVAKILSVIYPEAPVNIINAGVSGDRAPGGLERLERDVLAYNPDLTVVCFGLNDCGNGIEAYTDALRKIFIKLKAAGGEVIFMTPNMMNTSISCHVINSKEPMITEIADTSFKSQTEGIMDSYIEAAKQTASECGVPVCDVYEKWKTLSANGADITELLANKINHPTREMNWLFAYSLVETMMQ